MRPTAKLVVKGKKVEVDFQKSLDSLRRKQVYVGIPATTARERMIDILHLASSAKGKRRARLLKVASSTILNNAELVYIHTHGSPLRHIPARPIIEPAITQRDNLDLITSELKKASVAALEGKPEVVTQYLNRAGLLAQNIVRKWFTDPRNHWAPNAPSTIARKGSDRPLIDTAELRKAITYVVSEER